MAPSEPQDTPTDAANKESTTTKVRRFAPEPIETTTKSSKAARKQSPEETEPKKPRRFAPEPVETTTRTSKDHNAKTKPGSRRFAPEPIETTHKSSKEPVADRSRSGHIRFIPQLVETIYSGNRKSSRQSSRTSEDTPITGDDTKPTRNFAPVVLSTARRSRRTGDSNASADSDRRTEEGHVLHAREHQRHAGWKTPDPQLSQSEDDQAVSDEGHEHQAGARREIAPLDGSSFIRHSLVQPTRTHSFRCPDLETIESSESEGESHSPSRSGSPDKGSPAAASESSFIEYYKHATRIRESIDEGTSHYLLDLEAKKAEQKLLRDQALAAFPNSDVHEPFEHYVNSDHDSVDMDIEDRPVTFDGFEENLQPDPRLRRESTQWEQLEMQRHAEEAQAERNANRITAKKVTPSPWWNPAIEPSSQKPQSEIRSMRERARPPMLGNDISFPRCPSPEPARFDVTQGCDKLRQQMSYLSQHPEEKPQGSVNGLWGATSRSPSQQLYDSAASKSPTKASPGQGLWGGFCFRSPEDGGLMPPSGPTGLMTPAPRHEPVNPFEQSFASRAGGGFQPPTPPESVHGADPAQMDAILMSERDFDDLFERKFSDSFITQVFNYLSLGYPTLARPFDEELSKISRISIPALRQDDALAKQSPRGYIRLGPDFEGGPEHDLDPDSCMRWHALKLYVREWARQEKDMVRTDAAGGNWATSNRRGSWAW